MLCKSRILPYIDKKTDIPGIYLPGISVFYFYAIHLICYFMYTYSINSFSSLASSILEPMTQRRPVYSGWPSRISYSSGTISKYFFLCILTRCLFAPACEDFICVMVVMVIMIVVMTASAMIVMIMVVMMFMLMIVVIVVMMMFMLMIVVIVVMMVFMFMIVVIVVMMVFMFMLMIVIIMVVIMVAAAYRTDFFFSHHHISQRHRFLHGS